jgi:ATP-binding cassette subfamily B protein IrtB
MITSLKKIYAFSGRWKGVLKKSVVFSLLHSIFDMFQIGSLFLILNGLVYGIQRRDILFAFLLLLAGVIGKIVCNYISDFSETKVGYFMCADKRIHVGDRMKYMPMGYFNTHSLGNLTSTVTTTISDVENNAPSVLITVIHGFIHVFVITIVMFFFDWRIGLLSCLGIVLFLFCNSLLQKKSQEISPKRQAAQEELVGATLEYIQGMGVVKSFNLGGNSNKKMKKAIEESRIRNTKLETVFGPYGMLQLFVLRLSSVAIMFCSILFYLQGSMTLVYCLLMCVSSFLIFSELEAAGGKSFALRLIESSIDKVNAIDETPTMDMSGRNIIPQNTDIELKDVSFSYGEHQVLQNVNLSIPHGTTVAIIGPSGSGKTTLCSLIARFWDVQSGSITLGGMDIREYALDSLLSNFSIVFQNVYLFADTIENNIKFGRPDASHEEVVQAAKNACCHNFIMALPKGYDTVIGESGATLSGGEKQRISIARAILKNAPIIILDEATSSVDPENESDLQAAIEKLTENKTVIMIAHRLKTVRGADQIVVIDCGKITQHGTHEQLIKQPGIYADFINIRHKAIGWKL